MQLLEKNGDEILLIHSSSEEVEVGENIMIYDTSKRGLIIQIIEINLANIPGIKEDLIRNETIPKSNITQNRSMELQNFITEIRNIKVAVGKIRKEISKDEEIISWTGWMPDREAIINVVQDDWLINKLKIGNSFPIEVGSTIYGKSNLKVSAYDLQEGGTTVILGKKGTGKSHLTKTLLMGLIEHRARCIVFDINDEYSGLSQKLLKDNNIKKIRSLSSGNNLRFLLSYIGLEVFIKVLRSALGITDASIFEISRAWNALQRDNIPITLDTLYGWLSDRDNDINTSILGSIRRRFSKLQRTGIITDDSDLAITIEKELNHISNGGALVFNLKGASKDGRNIVVSTVLSKVESLLESNAKIPPLFLFAEEAHLYLEDTDWDDIITRMRHLGTFQFYTTNTPTSLPEILIRQTDNLFIFNLLNDNDFNHIRSATNLDTDTITSVAKSLPSKTCLVMGTATKNYPFVIRTKPLEFAAGETRRFFIFEDGKEKIVLDNGVDKEIQTDLENEEFSL